MVLWYESGQNVFKNIYSIMSGDEPFNSSIVYDKKDLPESGSYERGGIGEEIR